MTWESLDPELRAVIITAIGAIATTVIAYLEKIRRDLADNTKKTDQIQQQTNGERTKLLNQLVAKDTELYEVARLIDALEMTAAGRAALDEARARLNSFKRYPPSPTGAIVPEQDDHA